MNAAQRCAEARGIINPNTCGQGLHAQAEIVLGRHRVEHEGWVYSHTTAVTRRDGSYELHHTFKNGDHRWTAWIDTSGAGRYWAGAWRWYGSWSGSSWHTEGLCGDDAVRYLRGVKYRKNAKARGVRGRA